MNDFSLIRSRMMTALQALSRDDSGVQEHAAAIAIVSEGIQELKAALDKHAFESPADEIQFFKHTRPDFDAELIYHTKLLEIEQQRPRGGLQDEADFYRSQLRGLQTFFDQHREFVLYQQLGSEHLDPVYFLRSSVLPPIYPEDLPRIYEPRYHAPMSPAMGRLLAYDRLSETLSARLQVFPDQAGGAMPISADLRWTASVSALVELIYALEEYGVFNNTKVGIKKLAQAFSHLFHISLDNIYKIYENMRLRKKSRTPFLDSLRSSLLRRLEHDDEFAL